MKVYKISLEDISTIVSLQQPKDKTVSEANQPDCGSNYHVKYCTENKVSPVLHGTQQRLITTYKQNTYHLLKMSLQNINI